MYTAWRGWMSPLVEIAYCGEGPTDAAAARRLIEAVGGLPGTDYLSTRSGRGKDSLDRRLAGFNALARRQPVLVLRDLDTDAPCAGILLARIAARREPGLILRLPVRSIEAWLMADRAAFARRMGLGAAALPEQPEEIESPKKHLEGLLEQSRNRDLRRRIGLSGQSGLQGQLLALELSDFILNGWHPERAAKSGRAPSLARALVRLREAVVRPR